MYSADIYAQAKKNIDAVEDEMRRIGLWAGDVPELVMILKMDPPFAEDMMSFPEWLEYIFVPGINHIIRNRDVLPVGLPLTAKSFEVFEGIEEAQNLVFILTEFEDFFESLPFPEEFYDVMKNVITDIEEEMKRCGIWHHEDLPESAYQDMGPFGMNTMSYGQWLQFILIPRVTEIISGHEEFPSTSNVGVMATRNFDTVGGAEKLVSMLHAFDSKILSLTSLQYMPLTFMHEGELISHDDSDGSRL